MDRTITAWKTSNNDGVNLGKKASANLELLREDLQDKLNDVNETWQEMEGNNEGNKITRNALSRAVRSVARSTASSFRQIEEFQSEWQANINREKKKSKDDPYKQPKQVVNHSTPIPALPSHKISYQAVKTNIRPIPEQSRVTPPKNQNIHNSHSSTTKKDGRIKTRMPTTVLILPRPSSGRTQLKFNARFDTTRVKALLSEDVHHRFGIMDLVTYPGPVAMEDANGEPLHFMGEVTFKINILNRVTTVSAWVTNEIPPGQLILGSGVLEDLNLTLQDIPDILSHSGRAEDTDTTKDPHGSSPVTRASKS